MKTIRTISNISYNSDEFFSQTIESLVRRGIIDWAYWIRHKADVDEKKDHIHFVLRPSARIDTAQLKAYFSEFDPCNPSKPFSCTSKWMPCNSMDDWLLYAVHDIGYLRSKGQTRNFRYEYTDLCSTDEDALLADWNSIDRIKFDRLRILSEAVDERIPFFMLVQNGVVPIAQRAQYERQYTDLLNYKKHPVSRFVSHETGEIFDDEETTF